MNKHVSIEKIDSGYVVVLQPGNAMTEQKRLAANFSELVEVLKGHLDQPTVQERLDNLKAGDGGA
ncbi:hypothetical protein DRQ25_05230 [Candidatus Fermentibacteria bacterium]|nr:MAG: hypothetical protein DRQ25_05230 [Candidatus Fermentibacteria bacterium]